MLNYPSCTEVLDHLPAYCDGELEMDHQLSIRGHLDECGSCRAEAESLQALGAALRGASARRLETATDEIASVHTRVLTRAQAERAQSLLRRAERLFDDMHFVWAAAGATVATAICLLAVLGFMRLALSEVPHSMAAVIGAMANPGSNRNPVSIDSRMLLPRPYSDATMAPAVLKGESVLAVSAVVTREGEVRNVALLGPGADRSAGQERAMSQLLDAVSQTRFEPARAGGSPVAVNVVWLLAHTTVVGKDGIEVIRQSPPEWRGVRDLPRRAAPPPPANVPISSSEPASEPEPSSVSA